MPNWCSNFITFYGYGPDGDKAINHFNRILIDAWNKYHTSNGILWEADIEDYVYGNNCLFRWNSMPFNKRGYITSISDVNYNSFHIDSDDAWSANVSFWATLISDMFGNSIRFTYIAEECGMGLYYTNDPGYLPRYMLYAYDDIDTQTALGIPGFWIPEQSDNLFKFFNRNNPYAFYSNYNKRICLDLDIAGDIDEVIMDCEDYIFGESKPDITNMEELRDAIDNIIGKDITYIDEFKLLSIGDNLKEDIYYLYAIQEYHKAKEKGCIVNDFIIDIFDKFKKVLGANDVTEEDCKEMLNKLCSKRGDNYDMS